MAKKQETQIYAEHRNIHEHHRRIEEKIKKSQLHKKGWTKKQIDNAKKILKEAYLQKTKFVRFLDYSIYWVMLALIIFGNFVISITLVPFLLVLSGPYLIFMLIFLALVFGYIFTILLNEIDHFVHSKLIIAELLVPAIGLIKIHMITTFTNHIARLMDLKGGIHNPYAVTFLYTFTFTIPRIYFLLIRWQAKRKCSEKRISTYIVG